jgi:hypothetical protein
MVYLLVFVVAVALFKIYLSHSGIFALQKVLEIDFIHIAMTGFAVPGLVS